MSQAEESASECPECGHLATLGDGDAWSALICASCSRPFRARPRKIVEKLRARIGAASATLPDPATANQICVIEDVRSGFNVGSILRSCDGIGWAHVCMVGITGQATSKEVAKTALGAEQFVPSSYHLSSVELLDSLAVRGYECVALEQRPDAIPLSGFSSGGPIALVVGNEVWGVSPEALRRCARAVHIPMHGKKASLNVAVAFGIAAYAIKHAR